MTHSEARQGEWQPPRAPALVALAFATLAFALRVYHLGSQSLWYDEGFSVYLAGMSLAEIASRTASDIHPPLYYFLLHLWLQAAGRTEFALRFPSAVFSVLTVPIVYRLGFVLAHLRSDVPVESSRRARAVGLAAAALATLSPFYVWYAQEARMYSLLTLLGAATSLLLVRILAGGAQRQPRHIAAWTLLNVLAVYTHFYAFFILAFQAVAVVIHSLYGDKRPEARRLLAPVALVVAAYVPWLGVTFTRLGADVSYWEGQLNIGEVVSESFLAFAAGHTAAAGEESLIGLLYLVLLVWGTAAVLADSRRAARSGGSPAPAAIVLLYLVVPFVLLSAVSFGRPKFHPRYLMMASPAFYLLIAWGLAALIHQRDSAGRSLRITLRLAAAGAAVFLLLATSIPLAHYYRNEVLARDDFRSVAGWIADRIAPDEGVVLVSGHMFPVFEYYYHRPVALKLPDLPTLSTRDTISYGVAESLNRGLDGKTGAWVVLWQDNVVDPNGIVLSMLEQQGQSLPVDQSFWGVSLRHYSLPSPIHFTSTPPSQASLDITFGEYLHLSGYRTTAQTVYSGEPLTLTLYWQARRLLAEDFQVTLELVDSEGQQWGSFQGRPAAYQHPTFRWRPEETVPGTVSISVTPGAPPGQYAIRASVYSATSGSRLEAQGAGGAPLGQAPVIGVVTLTSARNQLDRSALKDLIQVVVDRAVSSDVLLLGHDLQRADVRPGDLVPLTLVWQALSRPNRDYRLQFELRDSGGRTTGVREVKIAPADFMPSAWRAGEIVATKTAYLVPAGIQAGDWRLMARLMDGNAPAGEEADLAPVKVTSRTAPPAAGEPPHRIEARFEQGIRLSGFGITRIASGIEVTLYWSADGEVQKQYAVFVHVLSADGTIAGQHDSMPVGGEWPTTAWKPGMVIADAHVIKLPQRPQPVRLAVGLYDPLSGRRLALAGTDEDRLILGPVDLQQ